MCSEVWAVGERVERPVRGAAEGWQPGDVRQSGVIGRALVAGLVLAACSSPSTSAGGVPWSRRAHWERIADGPPDVRESSTVIWTGNEVLVLGGKTYTSADPYERTDGPRRDPHEYGAAETTDGARFDPATRTWSTIASAPGPYRGANAQAVWTGREVIIAGAEQGRSTGARYDPKQDRWAPIAATDIVSYGVMTWTGKEVMVIGNGNGHLAAAAYAPDTDRWRELARPPASNGPRSYGGSVWAAVPGGVLFGIAADLDHPLLYEAGADRWRAGAGVGPVERSSFDHPDGERMGVEVHWTGDAMIETSQTVLSSPGGDTASSQPVFARYDRGRDRWTPMRSPPRPLHGNGSMVVDHHAVFRPSAFGDPEPILAYDGLHDRWDSLPAPPKAGELIWTGAGLLLIASGDAAEPAGSVHRLVAD
jgi:hypothetical protein